MFWWRADDDRVTVVVTDRDGGRSRGAFASLNLGGHVGDDPDDVEANRAALAYALGVERPRLLFLDQCHSARAVVADGPWAHAAPQADAVVTREPGLALAVLVADCVPVLLADVSAGVVGAVHAGREGLLAGVVPAALGAMRRLGATATRAVVGPSVCPRCYEVPGPMRDAATAALPETASRSWTGTPALDLAAGAVAQLHDAGVPVRWLAGCTREEPRLFSHRRGAPTGRFACVVGLFPPPPARRRTDPV